MTTNPADQSFPSEPTKPVQTLFKAVSSIKLRLVRLLIEGGIDVNIRYDREQTPLLAACSSLHKAHLTGETRKEVVKYLISAGANVNVQDDTGRTPLIYAVVTQAQPSIIFDLVQAGAKLWIEDKSEKCAFDYALQRQDMKQVSVIVEAYKRCNSTSPNNSTRVRKKLSGIFKPGKITLTPKRKTSEEKKAHKVSQKHKEGNNSHSIYAALREMQNPIIPQAAAEPSTSTANPSVSENERLFCNLCRNIVQEDEISKTGKVSNGYNKSEKSTNLLDLNFEEYNLSGLIYRRRSTGSLMGLTEEQCEAIKRKDALGITLEDLFSTPEINLPNIGSNESLFVKSPRTNTMVDISSKSLLVPGGSRVRSASVCLPTKANQTLNQYPLAMSRAFSFSHGDEDHGLPREPSTAASSDDIYQAMRKRKFGLQQMYMTEYSGQDDDDWDDILVIPSSHIAVTPTNDSVVNPENEVFSSDEPVHSSSVISDAEGSSSRTSPIPRIVLTDFVNESSMEQDE